MSIFWQRRRERGGLKDKPLPFLGDETAKKFFRFKFVLGQINGQFPERD